MFVKVLLSLFCLLAHSCHGQVSDESLSIPYLKLSNGVEMPMMGLGTWEYNESTTFNAVLDALRLGYKHIDTAHIYENQKGVGRALNLWENTLLQGSRKDIFITTKINGGLTYEEATAQINQAFDELQTDIIDLLFVHFPADWEQKKTGPHLRLEGWRAMEDFYNNKTKNKRIRAIGVSHFCRQHVMDLLDHGEMKPHIIQVEYHVGMGSADGDATDDKEWMQSHNITYESFSPLCGPCNTKELINGKLVTEIGKRHGKTGAQVSLRWQVQQGIPVIPKTTSTKHMLENADLFSWSLTDEEMEMLSRKTFPPVSGGGDNRTSGDCKVK
uniref:NADP-dependent oxidoreductase domain-containing protein n=1 Tax=Mucochytrium quahogii TaxID=96639 RepID=A0A7S2RTM2_9STRA|mmetsp:Transcript_18990/g.31052  ORF Transcript_18990/g.31052 Transcript_18990/m.31052 type:complete len:328 (+) Transcript_18990:39-1022(+)